MEIAEASYEGIPIFRINGEVDHLTAASLRAALDSRLHGNQRALLLDLTECPFLDSGGLGVLFAALLKLKESSGWLGVVGANANLARVFEIVGLPSNPEFRSFAGLSEVTADGGGGDGQGASLSV